MKKIVRSSKLFSSIQLSCHLSCALAKSFTIVSPSGLALNRHNSQTCSEWWHPTSVHPLWLLSFLWQLLPVFLGLHLLLLLLTILRNLLVWVLSGVNTYHTHPSTYCLPSPSLKLCSVWQSKLNILAVSYIWHKLITCVSISATLSSFSWLWDQHTMCTFSFPMFHYVIGPCDCGYVGALSWNIIMVSL